MDNLTVSENYKKILCQVINKHAAMKRRNSDVEVLPLCDDIHANYMLVRVGWELSERAHYTIIHLRLKNDKVRIEQDGIEYGIARDLIEAGIPEKDILLGFYSPQPVAVSELQTV